MIIRVVLQRADLRECFRLKVKLIADEPFFADVLFTLLRGREIVIINRHQIHAIPFQPFRRVHRGDRDFAAMHIRIGRTEIRIAYAQESPFVTGNRREFFGVMG